MNEMLWKLDRSGERLWNMAIHATMLAAEMGQEDGKSIAIIAEETRVIADKIRDAVEKSVSSNEDIDAGKMQSFLFQLNILVLNGIIKANHMGYRGRLLAVCAEEIRALTSNIWCILHNSSFADNDNNSSESASTPWAADPLLSDAKGIELLWFGMGNIRFVETIKNVKEICYGLQSNNGNVILRSMEISLINGYAMLGQTNENAVYAIMQTPWAGQNKLYAVVAEIFGEIYSPIGKPVDVPVDMPLAEFVRECWENENGDPFYFMDWTKMV